MPYAVELLLDERADDQVRQLWAALDGHGIPSLGSIPYSDYRPHVSLSVFEHGDPEEVADTLRPVLAGSVGLPVPLAPLGFFLTEEAPAFLAVVPSSQLLALHHAVHRAVEPLVDNIWAYYHPDALLPHCTLAMGVSDKPRVIQILEHCHTSIPAVVSAAVLVEIPGGYARTPLTTAPPED